MTQTLKTSSDRNVLAIIATLISVTLLNKFSKNDKLKIKMHESVPPSIARSFNVLIQHFGNDDYWIG